MTQEICVLLLMCFCSLLYASPNSTHPAEVDALQAVKKSLSDPMNNLKSWRKGDPCTSNWTGVWCFDRVGSDGYYHVKDLELLNMNLSGTLAAELQQLSHLEGLDFMWNQLTGSIPKEIGNLSSLKTLGSGELISNQKTPYDTCTKPDSTSRHRKANNTVLMDFDESTRAGTNGNSFSTSLSMSIPGNQTSDFLRLSTGNIDEVGPRDGNENVERERGQISWTGGWGSNTVASMGGPLAEVLRSSSNSSPTSVLHQLPRCSAPDTSFVRA